MFKFYTRMGGLAVVLTLLTVSGRSNTYNVSDTSDGNNSNQLRGAIMAASAAGVGPHTINIAAGTYNIRNGEIIFGNSAINISFVGAGAASTIIHMTTTSQDRIFFINLTGTVSGVVVTITGITFQGGQLSTDNNGGGAILCGGPSNSTTISHCIFDGNSIVAADGNGGAIAQEGGGSLSIDQCQFTNNTSPAGEGGALYYAGQAGVSGSLTVTNSLFKNNRALNSLGAGGALSIHIPGQAASETSSVTVQGNTIIGNWASLYGAGAYVVNSFSSSNTIAFNYNRVVGNIALNSGINGIAMAANRGNLDATNNWWGCNGNPTAGNTCDQVGYIVGGATGTTTTNPWLELTSTTSSSNVCSGNAATITAGFTKNSAGSVIAASNLTALTGLPVSFSANTGSFSQSQSTIGTDGKATSDLLTSGVAGTVSVHPTVDNVAGNDANAVTTVNVSASFFPATGTSATGPITTDNNYINDGACDRIVKIVPSGSAPLSGNVTARVTVDATQSFAGGSPYLQRHYDIEPASNASTATATVTLYATQADFDSYNAVMPGTLNDLPTGPGDDAGRKNLRITQFHGTGTAPGNYTGWTGSGPASVLITPGFANVTWNASTSRWEISFDVTGFSGFFITGDIASPLPVKLVSFTAESKPEGVRLQWTVGEEENLDRYVIERSSDGRDYQDIGYVPANHSHSYSWLDASPLPGDSWYRLRTLDNDGKSSYSQILSVHRADMNAWRIVAGPNPFRDQLSLMISTPAGTPGGAIVLSVLDMTGKILIRQDAWIQAGSNTYTFQGLGRLARGVYFLRVAGQRISQTLKVTKTE
jgi:hypothetical protein